MFFLVIYLALLNFTYAQNVGDRRTNPVVFTNGISSEGPQSEQAEVQVMAVDGKKWFS